MSVLLGTLKGRKLNNSCIGSHGTKDRVWSVRRMIGDFTFPLGRQSAAAGLFCSLGDDTDTRLRQETTNLSYLHLPDSEDFRTLLSVATRRAMPDERHAFVLWGKNLTEIVRNIVHD